MMMVLVMKRQIWTDGGDTGIQSGVLPGLWACQENPRADQGHPEEVSPWSGLGMFLGRLHLWGAESKCLAYGGNKYPSLDFPINCKYVKRVRRGAGGGGVR